MDGCGMDGWLKNEWIDDCGMDEWVEEGMDELVNERMGGWICKWCRCVN